jgi:hypothetical protein
MASDGCQSLQAVRGGATGAATAPVQSRRVPTAVWDGPPPRAATVAYVAPAAVPFDPSREPRSLPLPGGLRLPLLGSAASDEATAR